MNIHKGVQNWHGGVQCWHAQRRLHWPENWIGVAATPAGKPDYSFNERECSKFYLCGVCARQLFYGQAMRQGPLRVQTLNDTLDAVVAAEVADSAENPWAVVLNRVPIDTLRTYLAHRASQEVAAAIVDDLDELTP